MSITFNVNSMAGDFRGFSRAASQFLESKNRLIELETQLSTAVASAKHSRNEIIWSTGRGDENVPIKTKLSGTYRAEKMDPKQGNPKRKMYAEISFSFRGNLTEKNDQLVIIGGGTEIKLRWEGGADCATFHFDVHKKQDGHPTLHVQFASAVTEVPRLLSFYAHPLDVLEFTLMELFQADWQRSRIGTRCLADLQKYPEFQRNRILAVMRQYTDWLQADERTTPLLSLQSPFTLPFDLYPNP